jgi:hypothetical protein
LVAHLALLCDRMLIAWLGLVIVTCNVVSSLFNLHLFDFSQGWRYVFGVGLTDGTALRMFPHIPGRYGKETNRSESENRCRATQRCGSERSRPRWFRFGLDRAENIYGQHPELNMHRSASSESPSPTQIHILGLQVTADHGSPAGLVFQANLCFRHSLTLIAILDI